MEISGVAQLSARTLSSGPVTPLPQPVRVQQVDQNSGTSNAGEQAGDHPNQEAQAAPSRDLLALRRAVAEGDRPAGPPPSFDVSFLELETDLKQKLARMEAARSKERDAEALQSAAENEAEANLRTTGTEHSEAAPSMGVA